jgi:hypothetical protein
MDNILDTSKSWEEPEYYKEPEIQCYCTLKHNKPWYENC